MVAPSEGGGVTADEEVVPGALVPDSVAAPEPPETAARRSGELEPDSRVEPAVVPEVVTEVELGPAGDAVVSESGAPPAAPLARLDEDELERARLVLAAVTSGLSVVVVSGATVVVSSLVTAVLESESVAGEETAEALGLLIADDESSGLVADVDATVVLVAGAGAGFESAGAGVEPLDEVSAVDEESEPDVEDASAGVVAEVSGEELVEVGAGDVVASAGGGELTVASVVDGVASVVDGEVVSVGVEDVVVSAVVGALALEESDGVVVPLEVVLGDVVLGDDVAVLSDVPLVCVTILRTRWVAGVEGVGGVPAAGVLATGGADTADGGGTVGAGVGIGGGGGAVSTTVGALASAVVSALTAAPLG